MSRMCPKCDRVLEEGEELCPACTTLAARKKKGWIEGFITAAFGLGAWLIQRRRK